MAEGRPNSIAVIAVSERGTMYVPVGRLYMDKICVGPGGKGHDATSTSPRVEHQLRRHCCQGHPGRRSHRRRLLDRPRHADLIGQIRAAGAKVRLISDGDVAGDLRRR